MGTSRYLFCRRVLRGNRAFHGRATGLEPGGSRLPCVVTVDHKFFLRCCSGYMLQASGSTLGSAMATALSFVMTRGASSWLGPVQCVPQMPALARLRAFCDFDHVPITCAPVYQPQP